MPVSATLHVVVFDHDQVRSAGPDLLEATRAAIRLSLLPGDGPDDSPFDPRPPGSHPQGSLDGLEADLPIPGGTVFPRHQASISRMNAAATAPSSFPVS
jgi:hypothetical protein